MNLLQEFEWLHGEELASAALRVIVLDNPRTRNAVLDILSAESLTGPLFAESHFGCDRELGTKDEAGELGRLDLVLEMDDAVVGIEAKFSAPFQPHQLTKYRETLRLRAELLAKLRSCPVHYQLIIVAPHFRREEVREETRMAAIDTAFVAWEQLVAAVSATAASHDSGLERDFVSFVQSRLEFLPRLERDLPHLTRSFPAKGSELQCAFLGKIYGALGLGRGRLSRGTESCGYYLPPTNDVWLGFRPSEESQQGARSASLILASLQDFVLPDPPFRRVVPRKAASLLINGRYEPARYHWLVSPSLEWRHARRVRDLFSPVTVALTSRDAIAGAPSHVDDP